MEELLSFYENYKKIVAAYNITSSTMYYDSNNISPKNGLPYRREMASILAGEAFAYQMNPNSLTKLHQLYDLLEDDNSLKKELALYFKSIEMYEKLPKEVYIRYNQTISESENAWLEAKTKNDYTIFKPHLIKVIEVTKEVLSYLDHKTSDYEFLLAKNEPGISIAFYDNFFNKLKTELLPFIKEIVDNGKVIDDSLLKQHYPSDKQALFQKELYKALNIDFKKILIGEGEHPLTMFFSSQEARFTTKYVENDLTSAILSTIHEYGHALYSLQIDEKYEGSSIRSEIGSAMHESQSRFLENHLGRNQSFWENLYPKLQEIFPNLKDTSLEVFYAMMNVSRPSLIRTQADELTYPIHVLIRYELEKEIFDGNVDYDKLDELWADKYEEYLGIRPTNPSEGILQDMHWGAAFLGYFPTYALGSAYAAQFYHQMSKELDVDQVLKNNEFEKIANWLKENIHQHGGNLTGNEIIEKVCHEPFNSDYYINYLKDKYTKLYF